MMGVEPDDRNQKVVECYGNIQLCYELGEEGNVHLDLVHVRDVSRPCMTTIVNYRFVQDFGKKTRFCDVGDDQEVR